jgi:hypothetical protein
MGVTPALGRFDFVGDEQRLGDEGHVPGTERVLADGVEHLAVEDAEASGEDGGSSGPVEDNRGAPVGRIDWDAGLRGELQLFRLRSMPEEIVSPDREGDPLSVQVPSRGERERLGSNPLDVGDKAGRTRAHLGLNSRKLVSDGGCH